MLATARRDCEYLVGKDNPESHAGFGAILKLFPEQPLRIPRLARLISFAPIDSSAAAAYSHPLSDLLR